MRSEFVEAQNYAAVRKACPWAAKITKVEGGFRAFENLQDFYTWKNQK